MAPKTLCYTSSRRLSPQVLLSRIEDLEQRNATALDLLNQQRDLLEALFDTVDHQSTLLKRKDRALQQLIQAAEAAAVLIHMVRP